MSMTRCDWCDEPIDTDKDVECEVEIPVLGRTEIVCERCREKNHEEHAR